jgi:hypothetical protein
MICICAAKSARFLVIAARNKIQLKSSSMRAITVAAAQMGPIPRADSRQTVIPRMIALMDEAKARGADLIVYPELALTTFFPRWYMEDQTEVDARFEREMPNAATMPLFARAADHQMAMSFEHYGLITSRVGAVPPPEV